MGLRSEVGLGSEVRLGSEVELVVGSGWDGAWDGDGAGELQKTNGGGGEHFIRHLIHFVTVKQFSL